MVLAYYKKWITLRQLRTDCGVSRDGVKAQNMILAARKYDMDAEALCQVVEDDNVDIVLASMVGFAGLRPTISAIKAKKEIHHKSIAV